MKVASPRITIKVGVARHSLGHRKFVVIIFGAAICHFPKSKIPPLLLKDQNGGRVLIRKLWRRALANDRSVLHHLEISNFLFRLILTSLGAVLRCVTVFDLPGACTGVSISVREKELHRRSTYPSYLCPRLEFRIRGGSFSALLFQIFLVLISDSFFPLRLKQGSSRRADDSFRYERVRTYICMPSQPSRGSSLLASGYVIIKPLWRPTSSPSPAKSIHRDWDIATETSLPLGHIAKLQWSLENEMRRSMNIRTIEPSNIKHRQIIS